MRSHQRIVGLCLLLALLAPAAGAEDLPNRPELLTVSQQVGQPGGILVVALRAEPRTLNPFFAVDNPSLTVIRRLMADLIHIDRQSLDTVPALASRWQTSPDGRFITVELRRGIRFSDGHPLDVDDVLFTFEALLDPRTAAPQRGLLEVDGKPISVEKLDEHRVRFDLKAPYAVGDRLFDSVPVLPRHRLEPAYREGRLNEVWSLSTPPEEIVGLGPFRLARYVPGERLELTRNPHYWKRDSAGQRLPYLERLVFLFVANADAQALRFRAGEAHLTDRLGARNFAVLETHLSRQPKDRPPYLLRDLGRGPDYNFLFFNLNPLPEASDSALAVKQKWFRELAFRRAVSLAIDRDSLVRLVYQGRANPLITHVPPGYGEWAHDSLQSPPRSVEQARQRLRQAGFTLDAGELRDADGQRVEFSILTSASNRERSEIATLIQSDLSELGMRVQVVPMEFRALVDRVLRQHAYEACILGLGGGDVDPNSAIPMLTSDGPNHFWQLVKPSTLPPWQIEIDRLMALQFGTVDPHERQRLYYRVQELVAENLPMIFLVSPNVLTGAAAGLGNFRPATLDHFTLWNVEELYWRQRP
ncbi:MAG: ABC transporter substrate-binding protein [Acidobacteriota bacterium]